MHRRLIKETEQPKWNPAAGADFGVVHCQVAVREIGDLFKGLSRLMSVMNRKQEAENLWS